MTGMNDKYPNLPGHLVELKDGGLQLKTDVAPASTEAILFLGTATDGPVLQPTKVDPNSAEFIFGKAVYSNGIPNGATLTQAYEEAYNIGCRDIRLMRISGSKSIASIGIEEESITNQVLTVVRNEQLGVALGNQIETFYFKALNDTPGNILINGTVEVFINNIALNKGTEEIPSPPPTPSLTTLPIGNGVDIMASILGGYVNAYDKDYTVLVKTINPISLEATIITVDGIDINETSIDSSTFNLGDGLQIVISANGGTLIEGISAFTFSAFAKIPGGPAIAETGDYHINTSLDSYTLHANIASTGSFITVEYSYSDILGDVHAVTENINKTSSTPQTFPLVNAVNDVRRIQLYKKNGTSIENDQYILIDDGMNVLVKLDTLSMGETISANYGYYTSDSANPTIDFESIYGGFLYNGLQIEVVNITSENGANVLGKEVRITKPDQKKFQTNENPLIYNSFDYPTFDIMVRAINADPCNNVVKASTFSPLQSTRFLKITTIFNFTGGNDGLDLTKEEMYEALGGKRDSNGNISQIGAYQLLENYSCDIIIPLGVFADDVLIRKTDNFAYQLALACAVMSHRNRMTTGIIATTSPHDTTLIAVEAFVKRLEANPLNFYMIDRLGNQLKDSEDNLIDLGRFIEVLAGPDLVLRHTRLGVYATNSAATLGGFVSTLPAQSAPTNKILKSARGLRYEFSNGQMDRLASARYTTLKFKNNGANIAVTDAPTAAQAGSDYARLSTVRSVKECVDQIREVSDPFIGEPNDVTQRNALSAAISKRLDKLKELGVIQDSEFQIISSLQDQLIGQAKIELTIVPPMELRKITTIVSLKPML